MSDVRQARMRVVQGSCWSCKKRRVKCDLAKPVCQRCVIVGAICHYGTQLVRWSHWTPGSPTDKLRSPIDGQLLGLSLAAGERRALDYFDGRVWPLLSTAATPGSSPIQMALEHRAVMLATCVLAGCHKLLQEGRSNTSQGLTTKRAECLAAVRTEVGACYSSDCRHLPALLVAVLLLYFNDGYLECDREHASTMSHHSGVLAVLEQMGGLHVVLQTGANPLQMMLSEFVTNDLITALLSGRIPSWPPSVWSVIDKGHVWWSRDPLGMSSLASVFREMSAMAWYIPAATDTPGVLSMDQVRAFESVLAPAYAPLTSQDAVAETKDGGPSKPDVEAVHAFTLVRIFQHTALIVLYRAVCGLSAFHPTIQQHVRSCLDCIFEVERPSKVFNCLTFPLLVAGAHTKSAKYQVAVLNMVRIVYDDMRFTTLRSVSLALEAIWASELQDRPWVELFSQLNPQTLPL